MSLIHSPFLHFIKQQHSISSIVDRLSSPMPEHKLVEIITRNFRTEIIQELLYLHVESIPHQRKLVKKMENFLNDEHVRQNLQNRNPLIPPQKRQLSELDFKYETSESFYSSSLVNASVDVL